MLLSKEESVLEMAAAAGSAVNFDAPAAGRPETIGAPETVEQFADDTWASFPIFINFCREFGMKPEAVWVVLSEHRKLRRDLDIAITPQTNLYYYNQRDKEIAKQQRECIRRIQMALKTVPSGELDIVAKKNDKGEKTGQIGVIYWSKEGPGENINEDRLDVRTGGIEGTVLLTDKRAIKIPNARVDTTYFDGYGADDINEDLEITSTLVSAGSLREVLKSYILYHAVSENACKVRNVVRAKWPIWVDENGDNNLRDDPEVVTFSIDRAKGGTMKEQMIKEKDSSRQAKAIYNTIRGLRKLWHAQILHNDAHHGNILIDFSSKDPKITFIDTGMACVAMHGLHKKKIVLGNNWSKNEAQGFDMALKQFYEYSFYSCQSWEFEIRQFILGLTRIDLAWLVPLLKEYEKAVEDLSVGDSKRPKLFETMLAEPIRQIAEKEK